MILSYFQLYKLNRKLDYIMTAIDDLNAAVSALSASVSAEIAALQAALANNDSAAIETAVGNLNTLNSQLQASLPVVTAPTA